jgi:UDPglucose--hexose-1-phosphate uridylyltransferase
MNELRRDYLLDRWVLIAANRGKRPHDFIGKRQVREEPTFCFFCPGNEHSTPPELDRISKGKNWVVRAFTNMYPATSVNFPMAYGSHEVIVETPEHHKNLHDLSSEQIQKVLEMYRRRIEANRKIKGVNSVLIFKNHGAEAGTSLVHEHSQLISTKITPTLIENELKEYRKYLAKNKRCPYCDTIKEEMKSERRIYENKHFACFAPYASRFPFECWIFPKRHIGSLTGLSEKEMAPLAEALKTILKKLDEKFNDPPYNFYLHIAPFSAKDFHFHIEICPRLTKLAGFELGSDIVINIMPPEKAAEELRK